nr:TusE/DsrC/DsvC family sulfur relay protein [Kofleriaceae bacterium]
AGLGLFCAATTAAAAACSTPKPAAQGAVIDGIAYSADGHLMDASVWTRELGATLAHVQGLTLTDAHLTVLDAARADFATTKQSPNIRRLTQVTGMSTKDLYTLFPKAPGRTIAKVAGLPKPAGCL